MSLGGGLNYLVRIVLLAVAVASLVPLFVITGGIPEWISAVLAFAICILAIGGVKLDYFNTGKQKPCAKCSGFTAPLNSSVGTGLKLFLEVELLVVSVVLLTVYCEDTGGDQNTCMALTAGLSLLGVVVVTAFGNKVQCPACKGTRYMFMGMPLASSRAHI